MELMIDLETLDTEPSAIVLSVGWAQWGVERGLHKQGHYILTLEDQERMGRTMSVSTVRWWLNQSKEAQNALKGPCISTADFCHTFAQMLHEDDITGIWGNGSDFDNVILAHMLRQHNIRWPYSLNRCFRTLKNLIPSYTPSIQNACAHNAMEDAVFQAKCAIEIMSALECV